MTRTPIRPLARILDDRAKGENPDAIERENLRLRHEAMRDRARERAVEFDVPAIRERWLAFLRDRVGPAFADWRERGAAPWQRYPWYFDALLRQRLAARRFRAAAAVEQAAMGDHPSAVAAGFGPFDGTTRPMVSRAEARSSAGRRSV
jgi:hypothetical protein